MFESLNDILHHFSKEKYKIMYLKCDDNCPETQDDIDNIQKMYRDKFIDRIDHALLSTDFAGIELDEVMDKSYDYIDKIAKLNDEFDESDLLDSIWLVNLIYEVLHFVDKETMVDLTNGNLSFGELINNEDVEEE